MKNDFQYFAAILMILLGSLFLLNNLYYIDIGYIFLTYWPSVIILFGILRLAKSKNIKDSAGLTLLTIGLVFQVMTLDWIRWYQIRRYWPILLILIGILILIKHLRTGKGEKNLG